MHAGVCSKCMLEYAVCACWSMQYVHAGVVCACWSMQYVHAGVVCACWSMQYVRTCLFKYTYINQKATYILHRNTGVMCQDKTDTQTHAHCY